MKLLLVAEQSELKELFSFFISTQLSLKVKESSSALSAIEELKGEEEFDYLIAPFHGADSALVQYLKASEHPKMRVIFYYDPLIATPESKALNGMNLIGILEKKKLAEGSVKLIESEIAKNVSSAGSDAVVADAIDFFPIRTNLLIRATPVKSDIYIRLSEKKYVKLFRVGDDFDHNDLDKFYREKNVEYMYLKRGETAEFLQKFRSELDALLLSAEAKKEEAIRAVEMSQEAINEFIHRIGFTPEVQELAKKNVEITIKAFGQKPKLAEILQRVKNQGNYISQHSVLLAHVACCLAKEMSWGSDSTFSKLVLGAFMHDVSLQNPKIAKLNSLKQLEAVKSEFSESDIKDFQLHPAYAADLVRTMQEIPPDVDLIVLQHHERPDGSGFPRGLLPNYIAPLSVLFIVAHELTQQIMEKADLFSMPEFVESNKSAFNTGNFKKVFAALEKMQVT